jgi:hypothetical protein
MGSQPHHQLIECVNGQVRRPAALTHTHDILWHAQLSQYVVHTHSPDAVGLATYFSLFQLLGSTPLLHTAEPCAAGETLARPLLVAVAAAMILLEVIAVLATSH